MENSPKNNNQASGSYVLTDHFYLYIVHLKRACENINENMNRKLIQAWIEKLVQKPRPDSFQAAKRNTYLAQLIVNLYDGRLQAPFTTMPPNKRVETFEELPYGSKKSDEQTEIIAEPEITNKELPLHELSHTSSDERTYIAIQSLSNGTTLFGYVAVTIGDVGACSPLWINSCGEPIETPTPTIQDLPVNSSDSRGFELEMDDQTNNGLNSLVNDVWSVMSRRQTLEIRERAREFYHMLYGAIEQEMLSETNSPQSSHCRDPYVNKLTDFLIQDLLSKGVRNLKLFSRMKLLSELKKRTKAIICEIGKRQGVIDEFKKSKGAPMMELYFHPSSKCPSFITAMTLQEALEGTISSKTLSLLFVQYPSCLVKRFKKMITTEKVNAMHLIKIRLDSVAGEMYKDLKKSIAQGLRNYQAARKEWTRAWNVIKEYDTILKEIAKLSPTENGGKKDDKFLEAIENEIGLAHKRLENAADKTDKLEKDINLIHARVHEMNDRYEMEKLYAKGQIEKLKCEIVAEEMAFQERIATINQLQSMNEDKVPNTNKC